MTVSLSVQYFNNDNNTLLGSEQLTGITELLLPIPEEGSHPITLTRFFEGQASHRWQILRVEHPSNTEINLYLIPRNECRDEIFLSQTYSSNRPIASRIQKGTLVEVEYGYVQRTKKHTGRLGSNKRYPDGIQNKEMHKRRLAIVVNTKFPVLQVIPVTSVRQAPGNNAIFELSEDSLHALSHYNNPNLRSFALAHMVQSISIQRVLPPQGWSGQGRNRRLQRHTNYPHKLCNTDLKMLEAAMTSAVGYGDYQDLRDERNRLRQEKAELSGQLAAKDERLAVIDPQAERATGLSIRSEIMMEMLIDWRIQCYSERRDVAIEKIEEEITQLSEV